MQKTNGEKNKGEDLTVQMEWENQMYASIADTKQQQL